MKMETIQEIMHKWGIAIKNAKEKNEKHVTLPMIDDNGEEYTCNFDIHNISEHITGKPSNEEVYLIPEKDQEINENFKKIYEDFMKEFKKYQEYLQNF